MRVEDCSLSRRGLLAKGGVAGLAAMAIPSVIPRYAFAADTSGSKRPAGSIIVLFLRGAVDGLSMVVPHQDKAYYRARPTLSIAENRVLDLDGHFGLHPSLAGLLPLWKKRELAIIHATGMLTTAGYSHFDGQAIMEAGSEDTGIGSGWLARHLLCRPQATDSLRAISIGDHVAASLVGWRRTSAMQSLGAFALGDVPASYDRVMLALDKLYSDRGMPATQAAHETFAALQRVATLRDAAYTPEHNVVYPSSPLGSALLDIAKVVKSVPQLEAVTIDAGGWDTHAAQNVVLPRLLGDLAASLLAFTTDLGERMRHTTVVVMSEFGRRVQENSAGGTDHGHGNVMFVIGKGVRGRHVYSHWPGLAPTDLDYGDLKVTTDYRQVVSDVVKHRLANHHLDRVFPGLAYRPVGLAPH
ncbi:MAG TPA: DUF1501 domain-containing protein [Mycobacteriales bacterium]|jgi:uncharacterized protein (DUF1501 family)|nr:DUF1501 domain-containing protein [Mycobacteriales bacterium]